MSEYETTGPKRKREARWSDNIEQAGNKAKGKRPARRLYHRAPRKTALRKMKKVMDDGNLNSKESFANALELLEERDRLLATLFPAEFESSEGLTLAFLFQEYHG